MRKTIKAVALILVFAIPVWAGNMGAPVAPPPGGRQATSEPAQTGDIGAPLAGSTIARTLLQALLVRF